jgi:ABC-2 type transport system ATP-binding protein
VGEGTIEVTAEGARSLLPEIIRVVAAQGTSIDSVEVAEPDLEAVFLHLTGKALRD